MDDNDFNDYHKSISLEEPPESNSAELDLWRAVIRQLIEDFQKTKNGITLDKDNYTKSLTKYEKIKRQQSRLWYELNHDWFKEICLISKIDYLKVKTVCGKIFSGNYKLVLGKMVYVGMDS